MKKIFTLVYASLLGLCVSASDPTLTPLAYAQGNAATIGQMVYSETFGGTVVPGSYQYFNLAQGGTTQHYCNVALLKDNGTFEDISSGIDASDTINAIIETSKGTVWAISNSTIYLYGVSGWYPVSLNANGRFVNAIKAEDNNILLFGTFTSVNGTICNSVIRVLPSGTVNTTGLANGLPMYGIGYVNFFSAAVADTVTYFSWTVSSSASIYSYNPTTQAMRLVLNSANIYMFRSITWSSTTHTLYCAGVDYSPNYYIWKLSSNGQSLDQVLVADTYIDMVTANAGTVYASGPFSYINSHPSSGNVALNESNGTFAEWTTGTQGAVLQSLVFSPDGKVSGSGKHTVFYTPTATGISTITDEHIVLYPNPSTDQIIVSGLPLKTDIVLSDMTGRVIYRTVSIEDKTTIDVTNLASGAYFLNKQKFIKN